jgi:Protein of unknown function (DUF2752)
LHRLEKSEPTGRSRRLQSADSLFSSEAVSQLVDSLTKGLPHQLASDYQGSLSQRNYMSRNKRTDGSLLGRGSRAALVAWAAFLMGGFTVARLLEPDPRGFGTHRQFGLPECSVRLIFSRPCPGCGMTTSFAHFVRGEFSGAARANPAGLMLAMVSALMIPWSLVSAVRCRFWLIDDPFTAWTVLLVGVGGISLFSWFWNLWRF